MEAFKQEVWALRLMSANKHQNNFVIEIYCTFKKGDHFYMIFPWADGNLREFWEENPSPAPSEDLARWMAKQFHGIADGLNAIHTLPHYNSVLRRARLNSRDPKMMTLVGRHGDIKPENILRFGGDTSTNNHSWGILKISDFGLADIHRKVSERVQPQAILAKTPTYRAPESDGKDDECVAPPYDIWTLGCLYLEFITWYLLGFDAVNNEFCDLRIADHINKKWEEDTFFDRSLEGKPIVKASVMNVSEKLIYKINNFILLLFLC